MVTENKQSINVKVTEAAKILGISPQALRAAIRQDVFPFARSYTGGLGDRLNYYISRQGLEKFMDEGYFIATDEVMSKN